MSILLITKDTQTNFFPFVNNLSNSSRIAVFDYNLDAFRKQAQKHYEQKLAEAEISQPVIVEITSNSITFSTSSKKYTEYYRWIELPVFKP